MLALLAPVVGAVSGLLGAIFRLTLVHADRLRDALIYWAHTQKVVGLLAITFGCAAATAIAAWLVRRFSPAASGSGIPQVERKLVGEVPQAPYSVIPVKFVGGVLAIGAGLALGREGPSVQMGASTASLVGKIFRRNWPDCRVLLAAGAGAGKPCDRLSMLRWPAQFLCWKNWCAASNRGLHLWHWRLFNRCRRGAAFSG